jgi:hypothetical protein
VAEEGTARRLSANRILWAALFVALAWWVLEAGIHAVFLHDGSWLEHLAPRDSDELWMRSLVTLLLLGFGLYAHGVVLRIDAVLQERNRLRKELEEALTHVLSGFLPICASCKSIRMDDSNPERQESWQRIESYISTRTDAKFTHSICPTCEQMLYGDLAERDPKV